MFGPSISSNAIGFIPLDLRELTTSLVTSSIELLSLEITDELEGGSCTGGSSLSTSRPDGMSSKLVSLSMSVESVVVLDKIFTGI